MLLVFILSEFVAKIFEWGKSVVVKELKYRAVIQFIASIRTDSEESVLVDTNF